MTIKNRVIENQESLKKMSYLEIIRWAKKNDINSRQGFARFKKILSEIEIDFEKMKNDYRVKEIKKEEEEMEKNPPKNKITLFSDAKAKRNKFAICNQSKEVVWYGQFFESEGVEREQSAQELAAAKKSLWLAKRVFELHNVEKKDRLLKLFVDAEWLTWASTSAGDRFSKIGGKARELSELAKYYGIVLEVCHIPGKENPADEYTVSSGFERYQDNLEKIEIISN